MHNYSKLLDYQAINAYEAGNIASANAMASRANSIREFGQVGDIFEITNDAQKDGSFASIFVPLGTLVKAPAAGAKGMRAAKTVDAVADTTKAADVASDVVKAPEPKGPSGDGGKIKQQKKKLQPNTPEHKADRWKRYQEKGGEKSYDEWSKQYDTNMRNYKYGAEQEAKYREFLKADEGTVKTAFTDRQIDILKTEEMYAGQLKTGPVSLTKENIIAIKKDANLVDNGWKVEHILEKGASKPYLDALKEAGIDVHIGSKLPK